MAMTDTTASDSNSPSESQTPEVDGRNEKEKEHRENSQEPHTVTAKSSEPSPNSRSRTGTPVKTSSDDSNPSKIGEDIIPNAIVIKNIPFAIKKEQLLDIISEMELPLPYAFNYHFDNGIFRGLAFANFSTPEETAEVIANLNGKEINGRKLKVEYKKMLPLAERERIEREKRERRGQLEEQHRSASSMSLHSLSVMNQAPLGSVSMTNLNTLTSPLSNDLLAHGSSATGTSGASTTLFSTFVNPSSSGLTPGGTTGGGLAMSSSSQRSTGPYSTHPQPFVPVNFVSGVPQVQGQLQSSANMTERYYAPLPTPTTVPIPPQHLDFNDPETLEIYSQLLLFRDRENSYYELAYPLALSAIHKRVINVLCSYLDLVEIHDPRFIIIRRKLSDQSSGVHSHLFQQRQPQDTQFSVGNPMQATSTGGSINRSQSYIGMLHAHAATANTNAPVLPSLSAGLNSSSHDLTSLTNQVLTNTPKIASQPLLSGQFQLTPSSHSSSSQAQILSRNASSTSPPSSKPSAAGSSGTTLDQQQHSQTLLRQQVGTPTSRLPSGLLTTHQSLSSSNLLLRNPPAKQMSPTVNNAPLYQTNTLLQRIGSTNLDTTTPTTPSISSVPQALLQQNTNGSTHSYFSVHSFHEDGPLNFLTAGSTQNGNGVGSNLNPENTYRTPTDTSFNFEQHLTKSLSGLELSDTATVNNSGRKPLW